MNAVQIRQLLKDPRSGAEFAPGVLRSLPAATVRARLAMVIDLAHDEALAVEAEIKRVQMSQWLERRGVGMTPTPGTVARGVELDHADALVEDWVMTGLRGVTPAQLADRPDDRGMRMGPGHVAPATIEAAHAEAITEDQTRTVAGRLATFTRPLSALVAAAAERTGQDAAAVLTAALRAADGGSDNVRWDPRRTVREFQHASDRQLHLAMRATVVGHPLVMRILRRLADTEVELARANARLIRQAVER